MNRALSVASALALTLVASAAVVASDQNVRPEHIAEWFNDADRLQLAGSNEDAISIYRRILRFVPEHARAAVRLGRLQYQMGEYETASQHLVQAVELAPDQASYHNDAGLALWKAGKTQLGIQYLQRAVELEPNRQRYANNLTSVYVDIGEDDKAIKTQKAAHHKLASVHFNMAYLYEKRGRDREAMEHVKKALVHDRNLSRAQRLRDKLARQ